MLRKTKGLIAVLSLILVTAFPTAAHASCKPSKQLASKNIVQLHAQVVHAGTGQALFSYRESAAERSASVMKVLTAAVALDVLGPDYQVTTSVYSDPANPGHIYLVGAGDITLSRMPGNITSYYARAPKLDTLTRLISDWVRQSGTQVSEVFIDNSLYGSDGDWHPTWSKKGLSDGYMAPVSALQIDAARLTSSKNKNVWLAKRTDKPVVQAGELWVASLNKRAIALGLKAKQAKLPQGAQVIASVQSRPMREWIENMLRVSDNSLSEALGRLSSIQAGFDGSMDSLTPLYKKVLGARGLDVAKLRIIDASGLSRDNQVPVSLVNEVLKLVSQNTENYSVIQSGLPVSGEKGSLRFRFSNGTLKAARGLVAAKTGFITTGYSLAGFLTAQDGTPLIFTVYNLSKKANFNQRQAMDNLVYRFYQCGAKLSG